MTKYQNARQVMEAMDRGDIPRKYLGTKTSAALKQELFSLKNEYNPKTFTDEEEVIWNTKLGLVMEGIEKLSGSQKDNLLKEVDKMLDPTS